MSGVKLIQIRKVDSEEQEYCVKIDIEREIRNHLTLDTKKFDFSDRQRIKADTRK